MNSESNQSMKSSTNSLENSILSDVSNSIIVDQNDQKSSINSLNDQELLNNDKENNYKSLYKNR